MALLRRSAGSNTRGMVCLGAKTKVPIRCQTPPARIRRALLAGAPIEWMYKKSPSVNQAPPWTTTCLAAATHRLKKNRLKPTVSFPWTQCGAPAKKKRQADSEALQKKDKCVFEDDLGIGSGRGATSGVVIRQCFMHALLSLIACECGRASLASWLSRYCPIFNRILHVFSYLIPYTYEETHQNEAQEERTICVGFGARSYNH
jgi:hypothetical protein